MLATMQQGWSSIRTRIESLLLRDKHKKKHLTLGHSSLYVLPSKLGLGFLLIAVLNFILAANYQNNLVQVVSYLMLVLVLMSLIQAYTNLKGLEVKFNNISDVFANQTPVLNITVCNNSRTSYGVKVTWQGQCKEVERVSQDAQVVLVSGRKCSRGKYPATRLQISTGFPFGLAKVWSYLEPHAHYFVYPSAQAHNTALTYEASENQGEVNALKPQSGNEEFYALNEYKQGADYRRISWKHFAKREQLLVKEFVSYQDAQYMLDYASLQGSVEQRLSAMAYSIEQAKSTQTKLALRIGSTQFDADNSPSHYTNALRALALFKNGEK
ncbi:DUF58 domain-containing protein [Pseudoalteromonas sp. CO325X]|uniref:DUF58 domain-containing protein n=1 Tax=Pseudoalteromonas sp. CO325X TaxID=1777262 RepID=UPI0013EE8DE6|nr:DUF58 domain-containing protein [Pseudoalteromonas sp. CO325X]